MVVNHILSSISVFSNLTSADLYIQKAHSRSTLVMYLQILIQQSERSVQLVSSVFNGVDYNFRWWKQEFLSDLFRSSLTQSFLDLKI